jgi:hypothetical protein
MAGDRRVFAQAVSAVAVVLSLVFVGLEIRQATAAQRSQTRQALADGSRDLLLTIAAEPGLSRAFFAVFAPVTQPNIPIVLSREDSLRATAAMTAGIRNAENVFLQAREGVVDASVLGSYGFISQLYQTQEFAQWWAAQSTPFDTAFVRSFEMANGIK